LYTHEEKTTYRMRGLNVEHMVSNVCSIKTGDKRFLGLVIPIGKRLPGRSGRREVADLTCKPKEERGSRGSQTAKLYHCRSMTKQQKKKKTSVNAIYFQRVGRKVLKKKKKKYLKKEVFQRAGRK